MKRRRNARGFSTNQVFNLKREKVSCLFTLHSVSDAVLKNYSIRMTTVRRPNAYALVQIRLAINVLLLFLPLLYTPTPLTPTASI